MIINQANLQTFFRGLKTIFNGAFADYQAAGDLIATPVPSTTSQEDYGWLGSWPQLREWVGDRVVANLAAHDYAIKNKKFESTIGVQRDKLEDDQIGIFNPLTRSMAEAAAEHPDRLIFELLANGTTTKCFDGKNFFAANHPAGKSTASNLDSSGTGDKWYVLDARRAIKPILKQTRRPYDFRAMTQLDNEHVFMTDEFRFGVDARLNVGFGFWQMAYCTNQTLEEDNFDAAVKAMIAMKDDNGHPLNVNPNVVVVGSSNAAAARKTFEAATLANGATNTLYNKVKVIVSPWLD